MSNASPLWMPMIKARVTIIIDVHYSKSSKLTDFSHSVRHKNSLMSW